MSAVSGDVPGLRRVVEPLWAAYAQGGTLDTEQLRAMTEGLFRIAVHPATPHDEAVELLHRGYRADPDDGRFAYHLGRTALAAGRPADAETWLTVASASRPDDHRIAAHLVVALRALERIQPAEARAGLRKRARALSAGIRAGGLRGCRWEGIHDIEFQHGLLADVNDHAMDDLLAALTALRDLADRPGGVRAFVVAAVCWLVRGYPVSTVRELTDGLPAGDHRASYLLGRTCALFEVPEAELPDRLANALRRADLPELLVALIHRRRLLWQVRPFPEPGAMRAAQWFLTDDVPQGAADHHVTVLDAAVDRWRRPPPIPGNGRRSAARQTGAADALARLGALESELERIDRDRTALTDFISGPLKAADQDARTDADRAVVAADHALMTAALERVTEAAAEAQRLAGRLTDELGHLSATELGDDFGSRADAVKAGLAGLAAPGKVRRLLGKIKSARGGSGPGRGADPSPDAGDVIARIGAGAGEPASGRPEPDEPRRDGDPPSPTDVAAAVSRARSAVTDAFADAERTLSPYPDSPVAWHLRNLIVGHYAETRYRMGMVAEGRRAWHRLHARNGPAPAVLRNLAVANLCSGDEHQSTEMWRRYLAELYAEAIGADDPAYRAEERERVHGVFAAAYLPPGLRGDTDGSEVTTVRFLAGRTGIRTAIVHLQLEHLNQALSFRTTGLRVTPDDARLDLLPPPLREPFGELLGRADGGPPDDDSRPVEQEEQRRSEAIGQTIRLKQRVRRALYGDTSWCLGTAAVSVITNLAVVDALALEPDDPLTYRTALTLGFTDPATGLEQLSALGRQALNLARHRIAEDAARQDQVTLPQRYRAILRAWVDGPVPDDDSFFLDQARHLYDPRTAAVVAAAIDGAGRAEGDVDAAQAALRKWCGLLPGATGPACDLARVAEVSGDLERAWRVIAPAVRGAVHPIGRRRCTGLAVHIFFRLRDRAGADWRNRYQEEILALVRGTVDRMPDDDEAWKLAEFTYVELARDRVNRQRVPNPIAYGFDLWWTRHPAKDVPAAKEAAARVRKRLYR